jgi:hypothetical protein
MKKSNVMLALAAIMFVVMFGAISIFVDTSSSRQRFSEYAMATADDVMEISLSRFADDKLKAGITDGTIIDGNDTVEFHLVPALETPVDQGTLDVITVTTNRGSKVFYRTIENFNNIPVPDHDGVKFMSPWQALSTEDIKMYFETWAKVVKDGRLEHAWNVAQHQK